MHWSLPLCTSPPTPWPWETELDRNSGPESHAPEENIALQINIQWQTWHTYIRVRTWQGPLPVHPGQCEIMFSHILYPQPRWSWALCVNNTRILFYGVRNEQSWLPDRTCVIFLPNFLSMHLYWQNALPGSLTTLNALRHLISAEHCGHFVCRAVSQKYICGHANEWSPILGCYTTTFLLVTS